MTDNSFIDRLIFAAFVIGGLMIVFAVVQGINTTIQLSNNEAQQIRDAGGEIDPQSTAEARGLVAADLARRDLVQQRWTAVQIGGGGLVVIAVAWLLSDFLKGRRKKMQTVDDALASGESSTPDNG